MTLERYKNGIKRDSSLTANGLHAQLCGDIFKSLYDQYIPFLHQALIVEKIYIRKTFVLAQNRL
jgi:hypothetical protein